MFLQDAPPDTSVYMIAGYAAFFVLTAIYLISLVVRSHNLHEDLRTLEKLQEENKPAAQESSGAGRPAGKKSAASPGRAAKKSGTAKKKTAAKASGQGKLKRKR